MAKTREQKAQELALLKEQISGKAVVFAGYSTLTVKALDELRGKLRESGATFKVTKNTLLKKAVEESGLNNIPAEVFKVQLGIAASNQDEVDPNRIIVEFAKTNEALKILGGIVDGKFVDESGVRQLASLPSRDELNAKVVGSINAPLSGLVNVLAGNLRGLINVLGAVRDQKQV